MNEWVELGQNKDGTHNICCGVCGVGKFKSKGHARSYYTRHKFKYCPNCGAKMADRKTENGSEFPNNCELQTIRCPHCGDGVITKGQTTCPLCGEPIEQTDCAWK